MLADLRAETRIRFLLAEVEVGAGVGVVLLPASSISTSLNPNFFRGFHPPASSNFYLFTFHLVNRYIQWGNNILPPPLLGDGAGVEVKAEAGVPRQNLNLVLVVHSNRIFESQGSAGDCVPSPIIGPGTIGHTK